jgi:hypothetical protein
MTWLTVTEYLCHKWPRICSTCRKHFPVFSSFMTYHWVCNYRNTTSTLSEHMSPHTGFSGVRVVVRCLVFYIVFSRMLFVLLSFFLWSLCCLSFFFWSLCCLSFFDLQIFITLWYFQTPLTLVVFWGWWYWLISLLTWGYEIG